MGSWADEINSKIDSNLVKAREKDLRFFRVDEFKRNIERVDEFSKSCPFCFNQRIDISETVETIYEAIEVPGNARRGYDRLIGRLAKHMRKEHGFFAPYYFSYLYSFIGILSGLIVGFLLYNIFPASGEALFSASFVVGIITAYFAGTRKDSKIRSAKKLM